MPMPYSVLSVDLTDLSGGYHRKPRGSTIISKLTRVPTREGSAKD